MNVLCLKCALIFQKASERSIECPECRFTPDPKQYESAMSFARDAAVFGYFYRRSFEGQPDTRDKRVRFLLTVNEIFIFLALAVISGIVGGAAYDASKAAFNRIINQARKKYEDWGELTQLHLLDDKEEMEVFSRYILEFPKLFAELPKEIQNAILEEMLVDGMVDRLPDVRNVSREQFVEALRKAHRESSEEIVKRMKSNTLELNDLWTGVPEDKNNDSNHEAG